MMLGSELGRGRLDGGGGLRTVVPELVIVEDAALALPGHVGDPDASDSDTALVEVLDEVLPKRLVELL